MSLLLVISVFQPLSMLVVGGTGRSAFPAPSSRCRVSVRVCLSVEPLVLPALPVLLPAAPAEPAGAALGCPSPCPRGQTRPCRCSQRSPGLFCALAPGASLPLLIIRDAHNSSRCPGACPRGQRISVPATLWSTPMGKGKLLVTILLLHVEVSFMCGIIF